MKSTTSRLLHRLAAALLSLTSLSVCAATVDDPAAQLIQRGKYLATAGDCIACHTVVGGKPFAGGLALSTPLGDIYSTNITPSKTAGIGNYTLEQFTAAMRRGIRADGQHLYPAMPYTSYAKTSDDDIKAMYAYFMQGVAPSDAPAQATDLPFPFNIRLSMAAWNLLFLDTTPYKTAPEKGELWNRGAYLVNGLTHCSTCHTPRNVFMAEDVSRALAGADIGPWHAPNITADANSGIGGWSDEDIINYLRYGHSSKGQASGPMAEAVDNSLQHLTEPDLKAIAVYIKTVPAVHDAADTKPVYAWGAATDHLDTVRGVPWPSDPNLMTGAQLYNAHCATCHQAQAQGSFDGGLPALYHNTATGRTQTNNLVLTILDGIQWHASGAEVRMPGFKTVMSDQQVATLGNYLMQTYGNPAGKVTVEQVAALRSGQPAGGLNLVLVARIGMGIALLIILAVLFAIFRQRPARANRQARR